MQNSVNICSGLFQLLLEPERSEVREKMVIKKESLQPLGNVMTSIINDMRKIRKLPVTLTKILYFVFTAFAVACSYSGKEPIPETNTTELLRQAYNECDDQICVREKLSIVYENLIRSSQAGIFSDQQFNLEMAMFHIHFLVLLNDNNSEELVYHRKMAYEFLLKNSSELSEEKLREQIENTIKWYRKFFGEL